MLYNYSIDWHAQVRFYSFWIILLYFKWCWTSDGASNTYVGRKVKGCGNLIGSKVPNSRIVDKPQFVDKQIKEIEKSWK